MKKYAAYFIFMTAGFLANMAPAFADINVAQSENGELNIGGMSQILGFGEYVRDPFRDDKRAYLFMKEARLRLFGKYHDYSFRMETGFGGEEAVTSNVSLGLLDFRFQIPLKVLGSSYLTVGQFKVPYGRERLTYSGYTQFVDRSVQDLGFKIGRDVGAAANLHFGSWTVIAGVFTGGGRDTPQRYLPEKLGFPLVSLRAGYGNVDKDDLLLEQNDLKIDETKYAIFANGLFTKDSLVGHSSALNVKAADKSLLLSSNWNPYIAQAPMAMGQFWQAGVDAALRKPMGDYTLAAEIEANYGAFSNTYGSLHLAGGRAQMSIARDSLEVALRYAVLLPDGKFSAGGVDITGKKAINEFTPAVSYYFFGHDLKLVADMPIYVRTPVFVENNIGSYVATSMPEQASILTKPANQLEQHVVVQGRLMLQAQF